MSGIFNGIQKLIGGIETIVNGFIMGINFLVNVVKSLVDLIRLLATTLTNVFQLTATLPSWLIAFATASVSIAVLYMILGRNAGKSD